MNHLKWFVLILYFIFTNGCSTTLGKAIVEHKEAQGAKPLFKEEDALLRSRKSSPATARIEDVDLIALLNFAPQGVKEKDAETSADLYDLYLRRNARLVEEPHSLGEAWVRYFNAIKDDPTNGAYKVHRDFVQGVIIAASNQRCDEFKVKLQGYEADKSFLMGALATVFAGAGSIFTRANTARTLSGISGILSGTRAEFQETFYRTKTIELLTKAINVKRKRQRECMLRRSQLPLTEYTTPAAIGDAIAYHGSCNVITGLEEANDSITRTENIGLSMFNKSLDEVLKARKKMVQIQDTGKTIPVSEEQKEAEAKENARKLANSQQEVKKLTEQLNEAREKEQEALNLVRKLEKETPKNNAKIAAAKKKLKAAKEAVYKLEEKTAVAQALTSVRAANAGLEQVMAPNKLEVCD